MEQSMEELVQKQKKLTFLLGEKMYQLHKSLAVRFLYTSEGVSEESEVLKLLRLLDYLEDRTQIYQELYGEEEGEESSEEEESLEEEKEAPEEEREVEAVEKEMPPEEEIAQMPEPLAGSSGILPAQDNGGGEDDLLQTIYKESSFASDTEKKLFEDSIEELKNGTQHERELSISRIGRLADKNAVSKIFKFAIKDKSSAVRLAVVKQVSRSKDEECNGILDLGLYDVDLKVRVAAIKGLASQVSDEHQTLLERLLIDSEQSIRALSVTYLGIYYGRDGVKKALTASTDESPYVRKSLAEMLSIVKPEGSLRAIENMLSDKDEGVKKAAHEALSKLMPAQKKERSHGKKGK